MIIEFDKDILNNGKWGIFHKTQETKNMDNVSTISFIETNLEIYIAKKNIIRESKIIRNNISNNGYKFWLFITDNIWQDNSKIINYKKLWKRYDIFGSQIDNRSLEVKFNHNDKIKFAGVVELDENNFIDGLTLLQKNYSTAIIASRDKNFKNEENIQKIFNLSFPNKDVNQIDWQSLIMSSVKESNIVLKSHLDSSCMTLDFFMSSKLLEQLAINYK